MNERHPYGQRRSPPMTPEEREVAVRMKAAELQPNASPELQLAFYAEALLDAVYRLMAEQTVLKRVWEKYRQIPSAGHWVNLVSSIELPHPGRGAGLMPPGWHRGEL